MEVNLVKTKLGEVIDEETFDVAAIAGIAILAIFTIIVVYNTLKPKRRRR